VTQRYQRSLSAAVNKAREGEFKFKQFKYFEAADAYRQAINLLPDGYDEVLANYLDEAGYALFLAGEYSQAKSLYEQARALLEKVLGKEHPNVAKILNDIAAIYLKQGEHVQAKLLLKQVLEIHEQYQDNPNVATVLKNLAMVYEEQGKYTQAQFLYEYALEYLNNLQSKQSDSFVVRGAIQLYNNELEFKKDKIKLKLHHINQRVQLEAIKKFTYVGNLAIAVVHEVNQPVSIIRATTHAARDDLKNNLLQLTDIEPLLNRISQQAERFHKMIELFQRFARGDRKQRETINLNQLIEQTSTLISEYLRQRRIQMAIKLTEGLPLTWGNFYQLQEVLITLLTNAQDAVEGQKEANIEIQVWQQQDNVGFQVRDNGTGVATQHQQHLFKPFFTTKSGPHNLGLGLHIAREIVKELGGRLEYQPQQETNGSCFNVILPIF